MNVKRYKLFILMETHTQSERERGKNANDKWAERYFPIQSFPVLVI